MLHGRANGYEIEIDDDSYSQERTCADCGRPITDNHVRCRACGVRARIRKKPGRVLDDAYLQPTPPGYELIWYPYMALSREGTKHLRRHLKRRLHRYFARKRENNNPPSSPAASGIDTLSIHELIQRAWANDFAPD